MQEIKCPKCGEVFQIDEAGYAEIVKQFRNREFNDELQRQKSAMDSEKKMAGLKISWRHKAMSSTTLKISLLPNLKLPCRKRNRKLHSSKVPLKQINLNLNSK